MSRGGELLFVPPASDTAEDTVPGRGVGRPGRTTQSAMFAGPLLLYALLPSQNHNYADDSLSWAYQLTQSGNLINSHHLYLNPMRWLYHLLAGVGLPVNPVTLLTCYSAVWGALGLAILYRLLVRAGLAPTALWATLLCAFSAGYWSYSIAGDVYVPATALMTFGVYCTYCGFTTQSRGAARWYAVGATVAFTMMIAHHQAYAVFVLGIAPAIWLMRGAAPTRRLLIGVAVPIAVCMLALVTYTVAYSSLPQDEQHGFGQFGVGYVDSFEARADQKQLGVGTVVNIAAGETRALVSTNVLFRSPEVAQAIQERYPYRATYPFPYLVRDLSAPVAALVGVTAVVTLLLVVVLAIRGLWSGLRDRDLVLLAALPMIPQMLFFAWWEGISDEFSLWTLPLVAIFVAHGAAVMTRPLRRLRVAVVCMFLSTLLGSVGLYWNPRNDIDRVNDGYVATLSSGDLLVGFEDIQSDFRIKLAADLQGFDYLNFFDVRGPQDMGSFVSVLDAAAAAGTPIHVSPRLTHPPISALRFKESIDPDFESRRTALLGRLAVVSTVRWQEPVVYSATYFDGADDA
ncbi:ArnT family glycosyltransferase [Mycobacterium sp. pV006]|uniref:ArnT family glycosyltransferase n=1 Tax=Mycobacterium sp. pV006 TaxID=3238983 RepID=UPI00351B0DC8